MPSDIQSNVPLAPYSTMRLGGNAKFLTHVHNAEETIAAVQWATSQNLPVIMIGGGSNLIWSDDGFDGLVIVNKISGISLQQETHGMFTVTAGGGELWDSLVEFCADKHLSGLETLSLVPGTCGAAPVQNIGAYGAEVGQCIQSVEAYDVQTDAVVHINQADCEFGYRQSRFNAADKGRYLILSITVLLPTATSLPHGHALTMPLYAELQRYLDEHQILKPNPLDIRNAVCHIRRSKLPDVAQVPNTGSFYKNPLVSIETFSSIQERYPTVPHWSIGDSGIKLAAGWLIEQVGFKGVEDAETGMGTWKNQALVLVNHHATRTADLLTFSSKITSAVEAEFGITLEQEPEYIRPSVA